MSRYIMRLDDAADRMNVDNWNKMEKILDLYQIKPLVGVIPNCCDKEMLKYDVDDQFWDKISVWKQKGWTIALHGYEHVYCTNNGGINPVNYRSEFAGVSLEEQREKIRKGIQIFKNHSIEPKVFFAPAHTFDENTIQALKLESEIRIISDTIANNSYKKWNMTFVPQQSGVVRSLPFKVTTFCYHPNVMYEKDFQKLDDFCKRNVDKFINFPIEETQRQFSKIDEVLRRLYFLRR